MRRHVWTAALAAGLAMSVAIGAGQGAGPAVTADGLKGLQLRSIGPALATGRVADIEIDPKDSKECKEAISCQPPALSQPSSNVRAES